MIFLAGPEDSAALLRLINMVQPHLPWTIQHLRWQYWENPAGHAKPFVIRDGDEYIALYVMIPHCVSIDGLQYKDFWRVQDVMTHPSYRGRGNLHDLSRHAIHHLLSANQCGFTFPNKQSEGSFRRTGWQEFRPIILYVRDNNAQTEEVVTPGGNGIVKSDEYLDWRYRTGYIRHGRIVLKHYESTLHICEMPALDALGYCEDMARRHKCDRLTSWSPLPGFRAEPTNRFMFTFPFKPSGWDLTHGDSDVY